MSRPPLLIIFAGPNGSGKSTITAEYQKLPDFPTNYINPDQIVLSLNNENYARSVYEAAEIAEHQRGEALTNRTSFAFETVMSHPSKIEDIKQAKELDYRVEVIFVSTNDPEINVSRVRNRVSLGGHDVPEKKIRERYYRSLRLLPIILEVSDKVYLFDNSNPAPQLSATVEKGQVIQKVDNPPQWVSNVLDNLVERNTELNAIMSAAAVENSQKANINDANYTGVIHQITTNFIAQMVSENEIIIHDRAIVNANSEVGCDIRISYHDGNVHISRVPTVKNQLWAETILPKALGIFNTAKQNNLVQLISRGIEIFDHENYELKIDSNNTVFSILDKQDQREVASFNLNDDSVLSASPTEKNKNEW